MEKPTLSSTLKKKSGFANLKDTIFLKLKDQSQAPDDDNESSSYKELRTEQFEDQSQAPDDDSDRSSYKELNRTEQKPTLSSTPKKKSGFANLKDTIFLKSKDQHQAPDDDSESSSYKELNRTEETNLKRPFKTILKPTLSEAPKKKSGFANLKDTIFLKSKDQSQAPDNDSESSSYKELNRTEETALKRSFRTILPISQSGVYETFDCDKEDEMTSPYDWAPSKGLQEQMAGLSSPTKTKDLDSGIDTTQVEGDSVHLIPTATRESTPDSTGFSNQLMMRDGQGAGQQRHVNAAHVQTHVDHSRDQSATPSPTPTAARPPLQNFGKSMRTEIGRRNADSVDAEAPVVIAPKRETFDTDVPEEKGSACLPRALLFGLFVLLLIGAIVAVVVKFKETDPSAQHGNIIPNVIIEDECYALPQSLGGNLTIECMFDVTHQERKQIIKTDKIIVESPNQLPQHHFTYDYADDTRDYWMIYGPVIRCSSKGSYRLTFLDREDEELYTATVRFTIQASKIEGSMTQHKVDEYGMTSFNAICSISGDCHNYDVDFVGRRGSGPMVTLDEKKKCTSVFNDTMGQTITCTTQWDDVIVDGHRSFIGCRATDGAVRSTKQFILPNCLKTIQCNFNCSKKAPEREALEAGRCSNSLIRRCFPENRPVWQYRVCPNKNIDCAGYVEQFECHLSWCRSRTGVIYKHELVGELLCSDYNVKVPITTTTTIPSTTTTTTKPSTAAPQTSTTAAPPPTTTAAPQPTTTPAPQLTTTPVPQPTTTPAPQPTTTPAPQPTTTPAPQPTTTPVPQPTTTPAPQTTTTAAPPTTGTNE